MKLEQEILRKGEKGKEKSSATKTKVCVNLSECRNVFQRVDRDAAAAKLSEQEETTEGETLCI